MDNKILAGIAIVIVAVLALLFGVFHPGGAQTTGVDISCDCNSGAFTINTPNSVCTLTTDQHFDGYACFNMNATNVTINCNGYNVIGTGNGTAFYSKLHSNAMIKNCNVSGFGSGGMGVYYEQMTDSAVQNVTAISTNASSYGLYNLEGYNVSFINDTVETTQLRIGSISGSNNLIAGCNAGDVYLQNDMGDVIANNSLRGMTLTILSINNIVYGNNFTVGGLVVDNNQNPGWNSTNNTFYWNRFFPMAGDYIWENGSGNFYNSSTGTGTNEGNIYANVVDSSVQITGSVDSNYAADWIIGSGGTGYPYSNATSLSKINGTAVDYAPLYYLPCDVTTCQNLATPNHKYKLCNNLNSTSTCLNITAPNVTLDCKGYSINGTHATNQRAIYVTNTSSLIKNCNILNYYQGIYYYTGADYSTASNITYVSNGSDNGIEVGKGNFTIMGYSANMTSSGGIGLRDSVNSNILIDCQNGTIKNTIDSSGTGVAGAFAVGSNTTVQNCRFQGWQISVSQITNIHDIWSNKSASGSNSHVNNLLSGSSVQNSTFIGGQTGVRGSSGTYQNMTVKGNKFTGLGQTAVSFFYTDPNSYVGFNNISNGGGIDIAGSSNTTIENNILINASYIGDSGATNVTIRNNNMTDCVSFCLYINTDKNNTVTNNTMINWTSNAVDFNGQNGTVFTNNYIGSVTHGTSQYGVGVYYTYSANNIIANNTILGGAGGCIASLSGSTTTTFYNNTVNCQYGYYADPQSGNNLVYWNNFTGGSLYIYDRNGTNKFNTSINGHQEGNIYATVLSGAESVKGYQPSSGFPGLMIGSSGANFPYAPGIHMSGGTDYAPLTNQLDCSCNHGTNFTISVPNTICSLTQNQAINGTSCFIVNATNVSINCNGHSIVGNDTNQTFAVFSNQFNTSVRDCNISKFDAGIYFQAASNGTIERNNFTLDYYDMFYPTTGSGIVLGYGSNYNRVDRNNVNSTNGNGIMIADSSYNVVTNFNGSSSLMYPISLLTSTYNNVTNCSGVSSDGTGILVQDGANHNVFTNCVAMSVNNRGIYSYDSHYNVFDRCTAYSSWTDGTEFYSSGGNTIMNSNSSTAYGNGFATLFGGSNSLINSTFSSLSQGQGAYIDYSSGTLVANSNFSAVDDAGILFYRSSNNVVANSSFTSGSVFYTMEFYQVSNNSVIYNNTLKNLNPGSMTLLNIGTASTNNTFYWNNFTAIAGQYVNDSAGGNEYNKTVAGKNEGNIYDNVLNGSVLVEGTTHSSGFPSLYIGISGPGVPYDFASSNGMMDGGTDYAPLTSKRLCDCNGGTVTITTPNYVCSLAADQTSPIGTDCIDVAANNVTIECNGHTIQGLGANGIMSASNNTLVKDCDIHGYYFYNIYFDGVNDTAINNTLATAVTADILAGPGSSNNLFYWNNFTDPQTTYANDSGSGNHWNSTEGNIWGNVMSGAVDVKGSFASSGFPSLYKGTNGAGVPYTQASSLGKFAGSGADRVPLTPTYRQPLPDCLNQFDLLFIVPKNGTLVYQFEFNGNNTPTPEFTPLITLLDVNRSINGRTAPNGLMFSDIGKNNAQERTVKNYLYVPALPTIYNRTWAMAFTLNTNTSEGQLVDVVFPSLNSAMNSYVSGWYPKYCALTNSSQLTYSGTLGGLVPYNSTRKDIPLIIQINS